MSRFEPIQSRILVCPSRWGTSPWQPGLGPVRPYWPLSHWSYFLPHLLPIFDLIRRGAIPMDRAPIIDVRDRLSVALKGKPMRLIGYPWLRGLYMRALPYGVRLTTMIRWGGPNLRMYQWAWRWTARAIGPLWIWPNLQAHGRWLVPLEDWVHTYERWFAPVLAYDSGLVLDTRMLALMGLPIPLSTAMVDLLTPYVRLLSLADIPGPAHRRAFGWPPSARPWLEPDGAWLPGTAGRYSLARWQAFLDQFPHVPVHLPALRHPADLPPWLDLRAEPSAQPPGSVCVPPPMSAVSLNRPMVIGLARDPKTGRKLRQPLLHDVPAHLHPTQVNRVL